MGLEVTRTILGSLRTLAVVSYDIRDSRPGRAYSSASWLGHLEYLRCRYRTLELALRVWRLQAGYDLCRSMWLDHAPIRGGRIKAPSPYRSFNVEDPSYHIIPSREGSWRCRTRATIRSARSEWVSGVSERSINPPSQDSQYFG